MADGVPRWGVVAAPRTSDRDADEDPPSTHVEIELHVRIESPYRPPTRELHGRRVVGPSLATALVALVVAVLALTATVATYLGLGWIYTPLVLLVLAAALRLLAARAGAWIAGVDRSRDHE
jgi:hypothetical protein